MLMEDPPCVIFGTLGPSMACATKSQCFTCHPHERTPDGGGDLDD
jgi:hypothetical protein